jgi:hypothetical protein
MLSKIKDFVKKHQADIILTAGVILISLLSFAMGYIVSRTYDRPPLEFETFEVIDNKELGELPLLEPGLLDCILLGNWPRGATRLRFLKKGERSEKATAPDSSQKESWILYPKAKNS